MPTRRRTPKAPGPNRSVPILDRIAEGVSATVAAWRVVAALTGVPVRTPRPLRTVAAVLKTMAADGTPVVLKAKLPPVPTPDGYLVANGDGRVTTVVLVTYSPKRKAVRLTPSLGLGWGQMGRAWLSVDLLRRALEAGGHAWTPAPK